MRPCFAAIALVAGTAIATPIEERAVINVNELREIQSTISKLRPLVNEIYQVTSNGQVRSYSSQLRFGGSLTKLQSAASQANSAINYIESVLGQSLSQYSSSETNVGGVFN
jgi:hypothetical protein